MKSLRNCWIFGSVILFIFSQLLGAMHNANESKQLRRILKTIDLGNSKGDAASWSQIQQHIINGANPNAGSDFSALHYAAATNNIAVINFLLDHGADIEAGDDEQGTPLFWAALQGHLEAITKLLNRGANIESLAEDKGTALMCAANRGQKAAVDLLISLGANIEAKDEDGWTSLDWAAENGQYNIVLSLLSLGACGKNTFKLWSEFENMLSPYYSEKAVLPSEHWLHALVRLKNDPIKIEISQTEIKQIINLTDSYGNTPLDIALIARNYEAIPKLLALGADPWQGLFDGVYLAWRTKESCTREDDHSSIYKQILHVLLNRYWLISKTLEVAINTDVSKYIIKLEIEIRRNLQKNLISKNTASLLKN